MTDSVDDISQWRFIGYGLVTKNNLEGKETISVWPVELLPFEVGNPEESKQVQEQEVVDINGVQRKVKVDRKATMDCDWYCTVDGRFTPPNVTAGETIEIYQYGTEDRYRWVSNGRQPAIRRLEHVTYAYSNLRSGNAPFDGSSSYGFTYSTREKFIRIWTSTSDGEAVAYDFMLDTKESIFNLKDTRNNKIGITSLEDHVHLSNNKGSYFRLKGEDLMSAVNNSATFSAGKSFTVSSPLVNLDSPLIKLGSTSVVTRSLMSISQMLNADGNITTPHITANSMSVNGGGGAMSVGGKIDDHEERIRRLEREVFG